MDSFSTELARALGAIDAPLARDLDAALEDARLEYPDFAVDDVQFAAFVAPRLAQPSELLQLRVAELYLACACQLGESNAISILNMRCYPAFAKAAHRYLGSDADELAQRVHERVFIGTAERAPKLSSYSGRGELAAWVSVIAVRMALRAKTRPVGSDSGLASALARSGADPELAYLKHAYRAAFRSAFRHALEALPPPERELLSLRYAEGLTGRQIAGRFGVHPATISRRLDAALESVRISTLEELGRAMKIDAPEVESVMRLVSSQLEASVARYLR